MKNLVGLVEAWEGDLELNKKELEKMFAKDVSPEKFAKQIGKIDELSKCIEEVKRLVFLEEE